MSKALEELRQHGGSFPGGLWNVLVELDQRLSALEAHGPMLADLKGEYDDHNARMAAQAEQPEQNEAAPAEPPVQSIEPQQEPADGAQGGQS